jgi:hypothetical protein
MQRSHQRHTTKFDSRSMTIDVAKMLHRVSGHGVYGAAKQVLCKLQKKKQRAYDKKLCTETD